MREIFLDASYAVALASPHDRHHAKACELAEWLEAEDHRLVTTRSVVLEIGNALSRRRQRDAAVTLLRALEDDPHVQVVPLTEDFYRRGFDLFAARADKEWGLTDCISFVVMRQRGIGDALTADAHFQQAGFRPLLLG